MPACVFAPPRDVIPAVSIIINVERGWTLTCESSDSLHVHCSGSSQAERALHPGNCLSRHSGSLYLLFASAPSCPSLV